MKIFSNPATKSADICKNAVLPEKSKLLKNMPFWKIEKNISWIYGSEIEPTYKQVSGSKIITQPFQVRLDVFALFF